MDMRSQWTAAFAALVFVSAVPVADAAPHDRIRGVQVASLFGESDEEKAARLQHESDQDSQISDLTQRLHDLERALQQSTGQNEQLIHRIQELSRRIDQQQKDFDYKLCTLAAQQLGAGTTPNESGSALPCDTSAPMSSSGVSQSSGPPQGGTLGTLPQASAPQALARPQFDEAMNLLARARYDEARAGFRAFADANPKDTLAPQAVYWVGNIAFVQKDYSAAAQAFAEVVKDYPTSSQGAESTLKLGQSLIALGQKKEGCLFLGTIKTKYKKAPASILSQAAGVQAASCKSPRAD
jgi:tol-pal system protein YbgF